jgi:hypothetical protein
MPFTIGHAAFVIPLFRWRHLDPAALMIGSMVPDLGYFFHRFDLSGEAHTLRGSLLLALPLGCALRLVAGVLPGFLARPLPDPQRGAVEHFLAVKSWCAGWLFWITLSLLLGIWSHTILDSFTHPAGWTVRHFPFLNPAYKSLQHLGSLAGILVLITLYLRWRASKETRWTSKHRALAGISTLACLAAIPFAWSFASGRTGSRMVEVFVVRWLIDTISLFACAYFILAAIQAVTRNRSRG